MSLILVVSPLWNAVRTQFTFKRAVAERAG